MKYSIEELRTLEKAATPGPWELIKAPANYTQVVADKRFGEDALICSDEANWSCAPQPEDAEFIAAARNALPDILDLLEEGATIIGHLRENIPRGRIVDWEDRINAFLDKLRKEQG